MHCYRFDFRDFEPGKTILPDTECQPEITQNRLIIEGAICKVSHELCSIRSQALYLYANREFAENIQVNSKRPGASIYKGRKLYEVRVEESHILHMGDLDTYEAIGRAIQNGKSHKHLVEEYISGKPHSHSQRHFEVLATRGVVISKL